MMHVTAEQQLERTRSNYRFKIKVNETQIAALQAKNEVYHEAVSALEDTIALLAKENQVETEPVLAEHLPKRQSRYDPHEGFTAPV